MRNICEVFFSSFMFLKTYGSSDCNFQYSTCINLIINQIIYGTDLHKSQVRDTCGFAVHLCVKRGAPTSTLNTLPHESVEKLITQMASLEGREVVFVKPVVLWCRTTAAAGCWNTRMPWLHTAHETPGYTQLMKHLDYTQQINLGPCKYYCT